ncbi:hypothetical protein RvY_12656 [Ramazzottius varieornatus]|uniref:Uncharacterized protein n=1 Tax=Ramazzottius varieornatus TaxID=947166 RepID=A0A1D1VPF6_RAMVA|nr:hypothetical protein RvY_12656 [Ramazzottius varieornatus]
MERSVIWVAVVEAARRWARVGFRGEEAWLSDPFEESTAIAAVRWLTFALRHAVLFNVEQTPLPFTANLCSDAMSALEFLHQGQGQGKHHERKTGTTAYTKQNEMLAVLEARLIPCMVNKYCKTNVRCALYALVAFYNALST